MAQTRLQYKKSKITISSTCRSMILAGKTNEEIWSVLRRVFKVDDKKKNYPTWYRCEVKRKGLMKDRRAPGSGVIVDRRKSGYQRKSDRSAQTLH